MLNKAFWTSLVVVFMLIFGFTYYFNNKANQPARPNVATQSQAELDQWKQSVENWNQEVQAKVSETNFSSQGIVQLPNTGPSSE